jgi:membrane protein YdbS with pleckstrin-like domain
MGPSDPPIVVDATYWAGPEATRAQAGPEATTFLSVTSPLYGGEGPSSWPGPPPSPHFEPAPAPAPGPAPASDDWMHPSPRLWHMRRAQVLVATTILLLVALGATAGSGHAAAAGGSVGGALVVGAWLLWLSGRRYRAWQYQERQEDLVVGRGVLFRRQSVVPYGRMQFVDVTAGPVERIFGLSTVKLHTAAAASDARIPGLEQKEAARLRDRLAALGEAKAAGL